MELFDVTIKGKNYKIPFVQRGYGNTLVVWSKKFKRFYTYTGDSYLTIGMEVFYPFASISYPKIKVIIKGHECLVQPEEIGYNGKTYQLIDIYRDWKIMVEERGLMIAKKQMMFLELNKATYNNSVYELPEFKHHGPPKVILSCNMRLGIMLEENIKQLYNVVESFDNIGAALYQAKTPELSYSIPGNDTPIIYWDSNYLCRSNFTPNIDITKSRQPYFVKEFLPKKMELSPGSIEIDEKYLQDCIHKYEEYIKQHNLQYFSILAKLTPEFLYGKEMANSSSILKDLFANAPKHIQNIIPGLT